MQNQGFAGSSECRFRLDPAPGLPPGPRQNSRPDFCPDDCLRLRLYFRQKILHPTMKWFAHQLPSGRSMTCPLEDDASIR